MTETKSNADSPQGPAREVPIYSSQTRVPIYASGPMLLLWLAGLGPVFVYAVTKRRDWHKQLRIIAIVVGVLLTIVHLLAAIVTILLAYHDILPPWSGKIFVTGFLIWFLILIILLGISSSEKRISRFWLSSMLVIIIGTASFCLLAHPLEYVRSLSFRAVMRSSGELTLPEGAVYQTAGNFTVAGSVSLHDKQEEPEGAVFTNHGYRFNLGPGARRTKIKDEHPNPPVFETDSWRLFFFKPPDFNIRSAQYEHAPARIKKFADRIFRFDSDFSFCRQMYDTTYEDVSSAKSFPELVKAETLYLFKQKLCILEPPVYEFDNGHIKGFFGPRSDEGFTALVFEQDGKALYNLWLRTKEDSNLAGAKEYLLSVLASMRKKDDG
ncbi:MAG: hypothetical protein ACYSWZ_03770 [Planctomycetota bacterium]|jgi:hypothetical protein